MKTSTPLVVLVAMAVAALMLQFGRVAAQERAGTTAPAVERPWPPTSPVSGDARVGQRLYFDYVCYGCHGYGGETGAVAFVGSRSPSLANEENFVRFLRGRASEAPELPSTRMPSYAERTLSDAQAKDIYAYIRTFRSHAPPLDQIEAMKQILDAASGR